MLEAVQHKFGYQPTDDLRWPLINSDGISLPNPLPNSSRHLSFDNSPDSNEDENPMNDGSLAEYWSAVQTRYQSRILDPSSLSGSQMIDFPCNWSIIHMNVTDDKSTLFIARQDGGEDRSPLVFCVPLKGRRDNGSGQEEEHLTYENALDEFNDIVRLSDEGTKSAIQIKADDQEARTAWWKTRVELDTRLRELLENIEFCWLGAFKVFFFSSSISYTDLDSCPTDNSESPPKPHTCHDTRPTATIRENLYAKSSRTRQKDKATINHSQKNGVKKPESISKPSNFRRRDSRMFLDLVS